MCIKVKYWVVWMPLVSYGWPVVIEMPVGGFAITLHDDRQTVSESDGFQVF